MEGKNRQRQNNRRSQNGPANRKGRITRSHILAKILFLSFKRNTSTQSNTRDQLKLNENCQNHPRGEKKKNECTDLTRAGRIEVNYYTYNFLPALTSVFSSSKTTENSLDKFLTLSLSNPSEIWLFQMWKANRKMTKKSKQNTASYACIKKCLKRKDAGNDARRNKMLAMCMSNTGTSCNEKGRNIPCYQGANSYNILMNKTRHLTKRYEECRHLTAAQ